MITFDRITLGRQAKEKGFVRDAYEKVCRLADVLGFMESDGLLSGVLSLKGGTAINLTVFDLPRLSVDIDMDYSRETGPEGMTADRKLIGERIRRYMSSAGYMLSGKSKSFHALDSMVFQYGSAGGGTDNLKIEINYMDRCHVLPQQRAGLKFPGYENVSVLRNDPLEIFASKVTALLDRAACRDLYDISNLQKYGIVGDDELDIFRKCIVFYTAIGGKNLSGQFDCDTIDRVSPYRVWTELYPVLRKGEKFDATEAGKDAKNFLGNILRLEVNEKEFLKEFSEGRYVPELLFDDPEILGRIRNHPMALWKCREN